MNFYSSLAGNFEGVVQYNKDNRAFEVRERERERQRERERKRKRMKETNEKQTRFIKKERTIIQIIFI